MYAEFGNNAADTIAITMTYADTTSTKMFNILLQQIPCDVSYKWVPPLTKNNNPYVEKLFK